MLAKARYKTCTRARRDSSVRGENKSTPPTTHANYQKQSFTLLDDRTHSVLGTEGTPRSRIYIGALHQQDGRKVPANHGVPTQTMAAFELRSARNSASGAWVTVRG